MKQRITICDHCNLNVNEDGPRAGQITSVRVEIVPSGAELISSFSPDLCDPCTEKLADLVKTFVSQTVCRPMEMRREGA